LSPGETSCSRLGRKAAGVGEDDVVRVQWSLVPVDLGRAQREGRRPEVGLKLQIVDAQNDRTDTDHERLAFTTPPA
jgi:hypothetical protein